MAIAPQLVAPDVESSTRFQHLADHTTDPAGFQAGVLELFDQMSEAVVLDQIILKDGRIFEQYSQPQRPSGHSSG